MRAILIHGNGNSKPTEHWFPYLKKELEQLGVHVDAPQFPDAELARSSYWLPFLEKVLRADKNTFIVGHSSGAIAAMRYAETHHILGSALVGTYHTDLGIENEKLSGYFDTPWNWQAIKNNQQWIIQFAGLNDPWIPIQEARFVRDQLQTTYYESPDQGQPKISNGRLYMDAFSIALPNKFRCGTIDDRNYEHLSTVTMGDDTTGDVAVIEALQTSLGPVSIEKCLEISKDGFSTWKKPSTLKQIPTARVLYEEKWEEKPLAGHFALMEVPAGVRMIESSGERVDHDVIRGYLTTFIDGYVVSICIQDKVFSFKCGDRYFSLEIIKNELLSQAVDILKSYRKEQPAVPKGDVK
jgi:predicted alpha/beta hydrolase family esterase